MKKYFIYIIISTLIFTSCQKIEDILEPKILSEATDKSFPQTDNDVDAILAGIYANFSSAWGPIDPSDTNKNTQKMWAAYCCMNGWSQLSSATTDELTDTWKPVLYKFGWAKNENSFLYAALYQRVSVVARITGFVDVIEKQYADMIAKGKPASDKSVLKRMHAIAELKALRGWTMFLLYDWFGAVDVKTNVEQLSVLAYNQRPAADPTSVYTKNYLNIMIKDFKESIPNLYTSNADSGAADHLTKDVPRMLLMKHYMNYAASTGIQSYWDSAKVYSDQIINSGSYSLLPNYSDVFITPNTKRTIANKEVIWQTSFGVDDQHVSFHFQSNLPLGCTSICGISTKGNYWSGFVMPWDFYDSYDSIDTRKKTLADQYYIGSELVTRSSATGQFSKGALVVKWLISDVAQPGQFGVTAFRYADVLLSAAEIELNRAGGDVTTAQNLIKQVTDRSKTSTTKDRTIMETSVVNKGVLNIIGAATALAPGCDPTVIKEFLFQERGRELYWEGWRRMDMIRFKSSKAGNKYLEYAAKYDASNAYDTHWNLFPLPYKVMTEAGGLYSDNPGY
jgi:starch-binding outer membrane protein, SusD/RagB family